MTVAVSCSDGDEEEVFDDGFVPSVLRIGYLPSTRVVAHRGFWNTKGSAENSLAALEKAAEEGFYASEFDVRLTSDSVPVISHDTRIQKLLIETTPYARIRDTELRNGERLPTLQEYLKKGKNLNIRMVLEIKTHMQSGYDLRAVHITLAAVREADMENWVEYISFSLPVCREIIRLSPRSSVSYLTGDMAPAKLKEMGFTGIDYPYEALKIRPEWIQEAKKEGMTVNVWIVNNLQMMYDFILRDVDFITTDRPATLKELLKRY
jgi:glycerophosphoryl diester phosphodiesterase